MARKARSKYKVKKVGRDTEHALILVMGGDMRDLDPATTTILEGLAQALDPKKRKARSRIRRQVLVQPRFQSMRPLRPWPISADSLARRRGGGEIEVLALVDRFDQVKNPGIKVVRISGGGFSEERLYPGEEDPANLLPAALEACEEVDHVAVIFWGHGSGIFGGILADAHPLHPGTPWLTVDEAAKKLKEGLKGKKVDLIAVIGCFTGMLETLMDFEPFTRTFVGFENKADAGFLDWNTLIEKALTTKRWENVTWARIAMAAIKKGFSDYVKTYTFAQCAAGAWETGPLQNVLKALHPFVTRHLEPRFQELRGAIEAAVREAQFFDGMDVADLAHFVRKLRSEGVGVCLLNGQKQDYCSQFLDALEEARIDNPFVENFPDRGPDALAGLSVWLPREDNEAYRRLEGGRKYLGQNPREARRAWYKLQELRMRR